MGLGLGLGMGLGLGLGAMRHTYSVLSIARRHSRLFLSLTRDVKMYDARKWCVKCGKQGHSSHECKQLC